jgi:CRP/FNR family transcriptional regulator, anaerobic regulatory protein
MCTQLRSFLTEQIRNFTNEMYTEISYHFYGKNVKRNEILIRPGKIIRNLYFVNRGCLRRYFFAEDGREVTKDFTFYI